MLTKTKKKKLRKAIFKSKRESIPIWVHLWITDKCNEICSYCHVKDNSTEDPTISDLKTRIDHISELGAVGVAFMGGEPTLRTDLSDLILHADSNDLISFMTTNGKLLTPESIIGYSALGLDILEISIDGYDSLECSNKNIDQLFQNSNILKYLNKAREIYGMGVKFHMVLTPETASIGNVNKVIDYAKSVKIPISFGFAPETFSNENSEHHNIKYAIMEKLEHQAGFFSIIINDKSYFTSSNRFNRRYPPKSCDVGRHTLAIASNGKVYICSAHPIQTETDFLDVDLDYFKRKRHLAHIELAGCKKSCHSACAYTTSYMRKHPFFCKIKSNMMGNGFRYNF
jgi:MoaA/NifB/PqqE/SkfB family radical SAM enzyme